MTTPDPWYSRYHPVEARTLPSGLAGSVVDPADVADEEWVRLAPLTADAIFVARSKLVLGDDGFPQPRDVVIDRKLVPALDLVDDRLAPDVLCSERFVRALEDAGATGFTAVELPHATPNAVVGRSLLRLRLDGELGGVVPPATLLDGEPLPPVVLDGRPWRGDPVVWSGWFDLPDGWRALLVRGDVLRRLGAHGIVPPHVLVQRVEVRDLPAPLAGRPPGRVQRLPARLRTSQPLAITLDRVHASRSALDHELPPPADAESVRTALRAAGLGPDHPLGAVLRRHDGPSLFAGAIAFEHVASTRPSRGGRGYGVGRLAARTAADILGEHDVEPEPGFAVFARSHGGSLTWTTHPDGRVRAYADSGDVYGCDAAFEDWLADTVADLDYAVERRRAGENTHTQMLGFPWPHT